MAVMQIEVFKSQLEAQGYEDMLKLKGFNIVISPAAFRNVFWVNHTGLEAKDDTAADIDGEVWVVAGNR
jgi:hypothetical protein